MVMFYLLKSESCVASDQPKKNKSATFLVYEQILFYSVYRRSLLATRRCSQLVSKEFETNFSYIEGVHLAGCKISCISAIHLETVRIGILASRFYNFFALGFTFTIDN